MMTEARREACRRGGLARAKQFTTESQSHARRHVKRESLQAAGRKGFEALYAKDPEAATEQLAIYKRANPSNLEQIVIDWLEGAGIPYAREEKIGPFYVDFLIHKLVIRVHGTIWHTNNALHGRDVEARDKAEAEYLIANGYNVLTLWEAVLIDTPDEAKEKTLQWIKTNMF